MLTRSQIYNQVPLFRKRRNLLKYLKELIVEVNELEHDRYSHSLKIKNIIMISEIILKNQELLPLGPVKQRCIIQTVFGKLEEFLGEDIYVEDREKLSHLRELFEELIKENALESNSKRRQVPSAEN